MIKYFSKAFKITNQNLILTTPFILFLVLVNAYVAFMGNKTQHSIIFVSFLVIVFGAFLAGWFFMVQKAIELDKKEIIVQEEKEKMSFNLIKEFLTGTGEYFFSFIGFIILYFILIMLFFVVFYQIGIHFIGKLDLSLPNFMTSLNSIAQMKDFQASLSSQTLIKLNEWIFLIASGYVTFLFITMFWPVLIINKTKNTFIAFFESLKFVFKNFLPCVILFIYVSIINFLTSLIGMLSLVNSIFYFIIVLLNCYFSVYMVVLVFLYYDRESNKPIEQKIQDNSNCGADSFGQE